MNTMIDVSIKNKVAVQTNNVVYVCGNGDFVINFDFDAEWNEFTHKTARFVFNDTFIDIVFSGNECTVPVISNTYKFVVGVFAGDLRTTTPALISAKKSILCGNGKPAAPPDDVYNQILGMLNELAVRITALEQGGGGGGNTDIDITTAILGVAKLGNMKLA